MPLLRRAAPALPVLLLLLAAGCGGETPPAADDDPRVVVTAATVRRGDLQDTASAPGIIVPSRAADLTVYAAEVAEIAELPKNEGDTVEIGDILVRYDIPSLTQELAALQLEVMQATSRLERADADLARQTELFERGITSRNAFDTSRLEQSAAESALTSIRMRQEAIQRSDVRSVVRATFPGVVAAVWHAVGDAVRPDTTDPILRVVDPTRVQVSVQLPVPQLARIVPGQTATVRAIAADVSEPATVVSKAQTIDPTAPTGEVRLGFDGDATLALDTPTSVEILLDRRSETLIVPSAAVGRDDMGTFVMVAGEDGLAHRRAVRIGLTTPNLTEIVDGVEENTRVILPGQEEIFDGTPIAISR